MSPDNVTFKALWVTRARSIYFISLIAAVACLPGGVGATSTLVRPPNNLGLVGYWSFDDATGTKATDFSGNGNTGTLTNIANPPTASSGWTSGKLGHALNLDGTNDYVNAGNSSLFNFTSGSFTISFWVKAGNQGHDIDFVGRRTGTTQGWAIETNGNLPEFCSDTTCVDATKAYNDNTWHLITLSRSGTSLSFYRDGVLDVARTIPNMSSVSTNLTFGVSLDVSLYLNGTLDEMRIYNRALGASEIANLYQKTALARVAVSSATLQHGSSLESGLVGLWTFDGPDVTDKVYDRSGNNNNGYFVGGATTSVKVAGHLGQALNFASTSGYVQVSDISGGAFGGPFSACAWVRNADVAALPGGSAQTILMLSDTLGNTIRLGEENQADGFADDGMIFFASTATTGIYTASQTLVNNVWTHVCSTYDGSTPHLYVDGQSVTTISDPGGNFALNGNDRIGEKADNDGTWDGDIDDVRIYDRALSAAEVKQLYNLGAVTIYTR